MMGKLGGSLPIQGSELAAQWDAFYVALFYLCTALFLIVMLPMIYFAIRYRARPGHRSEYISHNTALEVVYTVIPTCLVVAIFIWGWVVFDRIMEQIPADAIEVRVLAKSWDWTFQYEDGRTTVNQMFVPVNRPIKLNITSNRNDVLHSFFVPDFRIKRDAVPGMFTTMWFQATKPGQHQIFCAEYCGVSHSNMLGKVIVLDEKTYEEWKWGKEIELPPAVGVGSYALKTSEDMTVAQAPLTESHESLVKEGQRLTQAMGCVACHSTDGSKGIGPSHLGVFGTSVALVDGTKVLADENYIRESIEAPHAKIVAGYENIVMPSYRGQLSELQMNAVIAYLKTLN